MLAPLLSAIRTLAFVKLDRVDEGVDLADLRLSLRHFAEGAVIGHVTDEEADAEWVAVECIPVECGRQSWER